MPPRIFTLADDKGFEAQDFVAELREINVTPHVAQNTSRRCSAIDGRITHRSGCAVSLRIRRHRGAFGWAMTLGRAAQGAPSRAAQDRPAVHFRRGGLFIHLPKLLGATA